MKKVLLIAVLVMFATVTAVFAQEAAEKKAGKTSVIYVCDKCQKVALKAGKCCDQDMSAMKVLAVKDGVASCCSCPGDCKCTIKEDDATKCTCGKEVKKVSLKGFFCCDKCGVIADKEGKCPICGGELKAVPAAEAKAPEAKAEETKADEPKAEETKTEAAEPAVEE